MTTECVLCGSRPTTNEHILPKWLRKYLGQDALRQYKTGAGIGDGLTEYHEWKAPAATREAPILCDCCNTAWGWNLETRSEPVIRPMVQGYRKKLSATSQRTVALWGVKTCMLHDRVNAETEWVIPIEDLHHLRQNGEPPPETFVWLSAYGGQKYVSTHVAFGTSSHWGRPLWSGI